jgi:hypothetical protein
LGPGVKNAVMNTAFFGSATPGFPTVSTLGYAVSPLTGFSTDANLLFTPRRGERQPKTAKMPG